MKNRLLILFCLLIPVILVFPACSESGDATEPTSGFGARLTALESGEATVLKLYDKRLTAVEAKPSGATVDLGPLNTKTTALQSAVDALKAEVATLKTEVAVLKTPSGGGSGGNKQGEYGELVDSNGDLELWLEKVGGDADSEMLTTSEGYNARGNFDFVVVNKDTTSSHSFRITLTFMPQTDVKTDSASVTGDNGLTFTVTPVDGIVTNQDISFKSNDRRVSKNDNEPFRVITYIKQSELTTNITDWDISFDILDKD